ncbi:sensor histidine kinase [Thalassotalea fusca]
MNQLYRKIHEIVDQLFYARNIFIALFDEDENKISFPYFIDEKDTTIDKLDGVSLPLGEGLSSYVIKTRQAQLLSAEDAVELIKEGLIKEVLGASDFTSWLGAPMISKHAVLGIIVIQSYDPDIVYYPKDLKILQFVADQVAVALENAMNSKQRQEAQVKLAEQHRVLEQQNTELNQTIARLERTQDELVQREKMASLGGLVAGIAHEINTPLGICVTGISHLNEEYELVKQKLDAKTLTQEDLCDFFNELKQTIEILSTNINRGAQLVKSFKQVAVDQSSNEHRTINVECYLNEIITSLKPKLKKTQHVIEIKCQPGLCIHVNAGALSQIVSNLIINSLIHGFIDTNHGHIKIEAFEKNGYAILKYMDNGVGVTAEALKCIFEPFYTTRRADGGSGLGTHLIYNLVTSALNGKIKVQSQPGKGMSYLIKFPSN